MDKLEFVITATELDTKLQKLKDMTSLKSITTMSQYVKLTVTDNGLFLYANDGMAGLIQFIDTNSTLRIESKGSLLVTAKILINIIQHAPPTTRVTIKQLKKTLRVTFGNAKFNLDIIPSEEPAYFHFPDVREPEKGVATMWSMHSVTLAKALSSVVFAASTDRVCRINLCGVNLRIKDKILTTTTTDGFRLARYQFNFLNKISDNPEEEPTEPAVSNVLIPTQSAHAIIKLLKDYHDQGGLAIEFDKGVFKVCLPHLQFYTKLVDYAFPDTDSLLPKIEDRKKIFSINSLKEFLPIIERVSSMVGRAAAQEPLVIDLKEQTLTLSTANRGKGSAEEYANVDYVGEPSRLGVASRFLLEILHTIKSDKVLLLPGETNEPLWIKDQENNAVQYLLMPMQI